MSEAMEIRAPDLGEVDEVDVVDVLVSAGDQVAVEDPLITLESDKASMDVPSPAAGTVIEIKVAEGGKVKEGDLILLLRPAAATDEGAKATEAAQPEPTQPEPARTEPTRTEPTQTEPTRSQPVRQEQATPEPAQPRSAGVGGVGGVDEGAFAGAYASPSVRKLARELGADLGQIPGTGRKGRITKEDLVGWIKNALRAGGAAAGAGVAGFSWPEIPDIDFSKFGEIEEKKLSRIQKVSKRNLHRSWLHAPHVTQHEDADVTELEAFRKAQSEDAKKRGIKLTPVAFLLKASAAALRQFPTFNASLHPAGDRLILKKYIHIGVAVDTPDGLVVPVIRDVDQKGIYQLAEEVVALSGKAREGKLLPQDFQGASFTITSLGGIGGTAFTPIINVPEVAILGASRNRWQPVWNGSEFEPRLMLPLSVSYDHRVIDGATACRFAVHLADLLGDSRKLSL